eukprot:6717_1
MGVARSKINLGKKYKTVDTDVDSNNNSISISHQESETKENEKESLLCNNTTDKHLNTITMYKLLMFGWIRKYCKPESYDTNNIIIYNNNIPNMIAELCFQFIYVERILFCFIASHTESVSIIQSIDIHNIYKTHMMSPAINIGYDTSGICIYSESQITFPTDICHKYNINTPKYKYHTIFKCGSHNRRESKAIIIPKKQFLSTNKKLENKTMLAYEWPLPPLLRDYGCFANSVSFSSTQGLVSIGGIYTERGAFRGFGAYGGVFQLKIGCNNTENSNYQQRWKLLRRMNTGRAHANSTFFRDKNGNEKLFVCGGDLNGSVEVYSFENNKWINVSNTNVSRECAGIYYHKSENLIFLGGGHGAQNKIECYDMYKNEWNIFPNTNCNHDFYPNLFIDSFHCNILYIISPKSNLCEYIDMREGKTWNILYYEQMHNQLFNIPNHVDFEQIRFLN